MHAEEVRPECEGLDAMIDSASRRAGQDAAIPAGRALEMRGIAHERARQIVGERRREVDAMAAALLKYEVLYAAEVDAIMAGGEITRDDRGRHPLLPNP